jgi:hypothetical protein
LDEQRGPFFAPAPAAANTPTKLRRMAKELADWLYYHSRLTLSSHSSLGLVQNPGEKERDFKIRLQQAAREQRDAQVDALEQKYAARLEKLELQLRKQQRDLAASEADYQARKHESTVTIGETAINFLLGRRHTRALSIIAGKQRMTDQSELDIHESRQEIADLEHEIALLESELQIATAEITRKWTEQLNHTTTEEIHPRRADVDVRLVAVAWLPAWLIAYTEQGQAHRSTLAAYALPEGTA